jgi:hypothetical protein
LEKLGAMNDGFTARDVVNVADADRRLALSGAGCGARADPRSSCSRRA